MRRMLIALAGCLALAGCGGVSNNRSVGLNNVPLPRGAPTVLLRSTPCAGLGLQRIALQRSREGGK